MSVMDMCRWSHLTWVRGLKQKLNRTNGQPISSHLTWVRGLKPRYYELKTNVDRVAPYVGAWVETKVCLTCVPF